MFYLLVSGEQFDLQLKALMFKGVEDIEMFGEIFIGLKVGEPVVFTFGSKTEMYRKFVLLK